MYRSNHEIASVFQEMAELLQIHGLGPRTDRRLYHEFGIADITHLEMAARSGRKPTVARLRNPSPVARLPALKPATKTY